MAFPRPHILILPLNFVFPELIDYANSFYPKGGVVIFTRKIFNADPKDCHLLGFNFDNHLYFDTRCPFGLRSSAMICQRRTKAVIYIFTQSNFSADVYVDDFYGAEIPALVHTAFAALGILFDSLGLASLPEKDSPPATEMVCLGILVNSEDLTLRLPDARLRELSDELHLWLSREQFTIKDL